VSTVLIALFGSSNAGPSASFGLSRSGGYGYVTPTNATRNQTINMADPINYITTMDILLGTPPQKQTLMFDLNFPTTVIYQSNCFQ
jgi:hypothetical protein